MKEVRKAASSAIAVLFAGAVCFSGIQAYAFGPEDNRKETLQSNEDAVTAPQEEQRDMDEGNQQNPDKDNYEDEEGDDSGEDYMLRQELTPADDR